MASERYLALLRGINVGGKNIIRMTDLKACFENSGCTDVATFIQSGNVMFRSAEKDRNKLEHAIERSLSARFKYASRVVLLTYRQLDRVVVQAPESFGASPDAYRYNVIFLKRPLTGSGAMKNVTLKPGVDTACSCNGVLYFSVLKSEASRSHLTKIIGLPMYQHMTIRNWNTTTRVHALMGSM